jgi:hypothetical protein
MYESTKEIKHADVLWFVMARYAWVDIRIQVVNSPSRRVVSKDAKVWIDIKAVRANS